MTPTRVPLTPSDRLLRSTRRRLAAFTLALVAALVATVGLSTLFVAHGLMRDNIDSILRAATLDDRLLHDIADQENEFGVRSLGSSDTFVLLVDAGGTLLSNPSTLMPAGLPDAVALGAASTSGREDIREGTYDGVDVRLLTTRVRSVGEDGASSDRVVYLQAGFVLTLQNEQERELVLAVLGVALFGLVGAAIVTVLVTRRALVPIRSAFATERRFVAAASHELRTPVTVIRSSAEILERESLVADDGRVLVDDVIAEAERLGTLVGDLITLASAEAGAIAVDREAVDLRTWFSQTSRRAAALAEADGIHLRIQAPTGEHPVVASVDPERLEQLVQILVHNAIQHSPVDGTVTLGLEEDRPRDRVRLWVRDQGAGIAKADRERIFEPFARLRGERRTNAGSGLGLSIARQLAIDHDAELRVVDDEREPGATLELLLPLQR